MANKYPYISSGGPIVQAVTQFRKSFPSTVDASTLKKLGLAPNNESYLINIFKFLNLIDENGGKTNDASKAFSLHKDEEFQNSFASFVRAVYDELFSLHKEGAWGLDDESLITYFRQTDQSTEIVGKRQCLTFKALAGLAGKRELSAPRTTGTKKSSAKVEKGNAKKKRNSSSKVASAEFSNTTEASKTLVNDSGFGLTVRVEINLPTDGAQSTYDRIFKSIKENLIDAYKA